MKSKTLLILVVVTGAAIGAAVLTQRGSTKAHAPAETGGKLFNDLAGRINEAASLTVQKGKDQTTIARKGDAWVMGTKSDYPVEFEKVKEALVGLADFKVLETKTSNPEFYGQLGVSDPAPDNTTAKLVTIKDASGKDIASVIVGNMSTSRAGAVPAYFVRKPGEKQSWLVEGRFNAEPDALSWMKRDMISVDKGRIKSVTVTHPAGSDAAEPQGETVKILRDTQEDPQFLLQDKPADRELKQEAVTDQVANGLSYLTFEDVRPAAEIDFDARPAAEKKEEAKTEETKPEDDQAPEPAPAASAGPATAEFRAFDGLVVTVKMAPKDGKMWATFAASFDEAAAAAAAQVKPADTKEGEPPAPPTPPTKLKTAEEVKKEVADLNARLGLWAFALPEYRAKQIVSRMTDMLKDPAPPAPAPGPAGPAAPQLPGTEEAPSGPLPLPEPR